MAQERKGTVEINGPGLENSPYEIRDSKSGQAGLPSGNSEIDLALSRLLQVKAELDARKALYTEYDELILKLVSLGFVSCERGGEVISVKDNFKGGNSGWTSACVRRFDIEVISLALKAKREKKNKEKDHE